MLKKVVTGTAPSFTATTETITDLGKAFSSHI